MELILYLLQESEYPESGRKVRAIFRFSVV
jgi:hypothetical protein